MNDQLSPVKRAILEIRELKAKLESIERDATEPIAVVGLACRFPGSDGPDAYWRLLRDRTAALDIWEIEYQQVLKGDNPVAEFVKGSWLKQFLDRLEEPERSAFEADYRQRVRAAYPPEADGSTLFPFRRLFILAQRAA